MHSARGWLAALGVGTPAEDPVVELVLLLAMSGDYTNGLRQLSAKGYEQAPTSALEVKYLLGENPGIVVMPNHNVPPY